MFLLLFCVWVILNGRITLEICILGILVSAAVFAFLCRFLDYSVKKELLLFRLFPLFVRYLWVLVEEIVKANVCVLKIILSPELQPEPAVVYFDTRLKSGIARVMLADSITLTPGTITVSLEGNHYCVHCLDRELAQGLEDSVFVELLEEMENKVWKQLNMPAGV
ncbi:MAG: Na+/H+ antiporter subunit E [Lachnospiraceae bacterium]|nr:Na+/H+ antiporter subunit E [Lachnospiraceae bacterium]